LSAASTGRANVGWGSLAGGARRAFAAVVDGGSSGVGGCLAHVTDLATPFEVVGAASGVWGQGGEMEGDKALAVEHKLERESELEKEREKERENEREKERQREQERERGREREREKEREQEREQERKQERERVSQKTDGEQNSPDRSEVVPLETAVRHGVGVVAEGGDGVCAISARGVAAAVANGTMEHPAPHTHAPAVPTPEVTTGEGEEVGVGWGVYGARTHNHMGVSQGYTGVMAGRGMGRGGVAVGAHTRPRHLGMQHASYGALHAMHSPMHMPHRVLPGMSQAAHAWQARSGMAAHLLSLSSPGHAQMMHSPLTHTHTHTYDAHARMHLAHARTALPHSLTAIPSLDAFLSGATSSSANPPTATPLAPVHMPPTSAIQREWLGGVHPSIMSSSSTGMGGLLPPRVTLVGGLGSHASLFSSHASAQSAGGGGAGGAQMVAGAVLTSGIVASGIDSPPKASSLDSRKMVVPPGWRLVTSNSTGKVYMYIIYVFLCTHTHTDAHAHIHTHSHTHTHPHTLTTFNLTVKM